VRHNRVQVNGDRPMFPSDDLDRQEMLVESLFGELVIETSPPLLLPPVLRPGRDTEVRLVFLWCGPCRTVVGNLMAFDRRPAGPPLLAATVQRVIGKRDVVPLVERRRILLDVEDRAVVEPRRIAYGVDVPQALTTECDKHGALAAFMPDEARARGVKAWVDILRAEESGATPKARGWKLPALWHTLGHSV